MTSLTLPGGSYLLGDLPVTRYGFGALQLTGPGAMGPTEDREAAAAVLREVVDAGVTHIDTSLGYGPRYTNELIRDVLSPYPPSLQIVTKVGEARDARGDWPVARHPEQLRNHVHENLETLGVETLDLVLLRMGTQRGPEAGESVAEALGVLTDLQQQGKINQLGLSNATAEQVAEAQTITPIAAVQNWYNLARRDDDHLVDDLAAQGIAFIPFYPLGGLNAQEYYAVVAVADRLEVSPIAVALAWLLQRSPNILLTPGTSNVTHFEENIAGVGTELSSEDLADLNAIGR